MISGSGKKFQGDYCKEFVLKSQKSILKMQTFSCEDISTPFTDELQMMSTQKTLTQRQRNF